MKVKRGLGLWFSERRREEREEEDVVEWKEKRRRAAKERKKRRGRRGLRFGCILQKIPIRVRVRRNHPKFLLLGIILLLLLPPVFGVHRWKRRISISDLRVHCFIRCLPFSLQLVGLNVITT